MEPETSQSAPRPRSPEAPTSEPERHVTSKALSFARKHPALSVIGAAGVGLIGGVELAAGLLLGAGVSSFLHRRNGAAAMHGEHLARDRARRVLERTPRELVKRARAVVQAARGKVEPVEEITDEREETKQPPPQRPEVQAEVPIVPTA